MLDQAVIPDCVQIAGIVSAFVRAESRHFNIIAAARFIYVVKRLVDVAHEVHEEFQGFHPVIAGGVGICQRLPEKIDPVHDAVVMIGLRRGVLVVGTKTIARRGESIGIPWDVHEVPGEGFTAFFANVVRPKGDGG